MVFAGIDEISVDAEKSLLTVIGDVRPTEVVKKLRKAKKCAYIESVGPYGEKNAGEKEPTPVPQPLCPCREDCRRGGIYVLQEEYPPLCTIL